MILPFLRLCLDDAGLFKGKLPIEHHQQSVVELIVWLKENLSDTEEMKMTMTPEDLVIEPEEYRPYFKGYLSFYAFLMFTYTGEPNAYYFNWREYATLEQREWIESWYVFDDTGNINLIETAKKLRSNESKGILYMREFKWVERVTDKVWASLLVAFILFFLSDKVPESSNLFGMIWFTNVLNMAFIFIGIFLIFKSINKWMHRKEKKWQEHKTKLTNSEKISH